MDRSKLLQIGAVALAHGLLSQERHAEAVDALSSLGVEVTPETFWIEGGFLEEAAFARTIDLLEGPPTETPTTPYASGPPASLLSVPSSRRTVEVPGAEDHGADLTRVVGLRAAQVPQDLPPLPPEANHTLIGSSTPARPSSPEFSPPPTPLPFPPSADPLRYRAERLLGSGGMGEVYECTDSVLGRRVAVKRLRPEALDDHLASSMLEREARVVGSLEHPNIIPVYDAGYIEPSGPFYAMRMVERPSLEVLLRKLREGDPATVAEFTLGKLLRAFLQVCGAVEHAHSRGVIHCDLKPANILLGSFGEVLVVDWGMAHSPDEANAYQGGTPGYMAPEQLEGRAVDPRTDVYALGAILYEILTLRQAFSERSPLNALLDQRRPVHPRARAPERNIPDELADAALRALEREPGARFPSASAFGAAIEIFLEGTRERERRELRARELTEQGDLLADSYEELLESRPERVAEVNDLLNRTPPWEPPEAKQPLWDAEDRQTVLDALCIRAFQSAVSTYEQALEEVPAHEPALRGLARLYRAELRRAHERRDDFDRVYFEGLLNQVDPNPSSGSRTSLRIHTSPEPAEVILGHVQENGRRLGVIREEPLGPTPIRAEGLPTGSYLLRLLRPGFADVLCPVLLRPGKELSLTIDLTNSSPKPGEVFIPGGVALLGGDETNLHGRDLHEIDVPAFHISTFPVSFQEYFEFIAAIFSIDPLQAPRFLPKNTDGAAYWVWTGENVEPTHSMLRWSDDLEYLLSLPVFGVDLACAEAYARWKSESTGRTYRLPTEDEWEKAARGTDGRRYPWGDRFDASFCKMRESRPDLPAPEPCGSFPADVSPYGVRDMAGGVAEWVLPPAPPEGHGLISHIASRGGAWCDWRVDCYLGARRAYFVEERSARVGFRLVREARSAAG
jgi:serine/threonine-protein kinase